LDCRRRPGPAPQSLPPPRCAFHDPPGSATWHLGMNLRLLMPCLEAGPRSASMLHKGSSANSPRVAAPASGLRRTLPSLRADKHGSSNDLFAPAWRHNSRMPSQRACLCACAKPPCASLALPCAATRQFPPRNVKGGHLFISGGTQHAPPYPSPYTRVVFLVEASGQMHIADAVVQFSVLGNA
jgi:hypothetical protein